MKRMRRHLPWYAFTMCGLLAVVVAPPASAEQVWELTDLSAENDQTSSAIGLSGDLVLGNFDDGRVSKPFLYNLNTRERAEIEQLGEESFSQAVAIDGTLVVGTRTPTGGAPRAFAFDVAKGVLTLIEPLGGGSWNAAADVSGAVVVGESIVGTATIRAPFGAFAYNVETSELRDISFPGAEQSRATAIDGQLVLGEFLAPGTPEMQPYLYDLATDAHYTFYDLDLPNMTVHGISGSYLVGRETERIPSGSGGFYVESRPAVADIELGALVDLGDLGDSDGVAFGVRDGLLFGDSESKPFVHNLLSDQTTLLATDGGPAGSVRAGSSNVAVGTTTTPTPEVASHAAVWRRLPDRYFGFFLRNSFFGAPSVAFEFGPSVDDDVYVGDWDGDGVDTVAHREGTTFAMRNANAPGEPDKSVKYGRVGDVVYVGDWDGNGTDTFAVRRGNAFYISNTFAGGPADIVVRYGRESDEVLMGDWDGNGTDTPAVRRDTTYYLRNDFDGGFANIVFTYGRVQDAVIVGDWDADSRDTLSVRRGADYFVNNEFRGGVADFAFTLGAETDVALSGDFNGDGIDTVSFYRSR